MNQDVKSRQFIMKQNNQQRAIANKIKKWIQATKEVEKTRFAIPITRLTSIKSLCSDEVAAEKFALYIAQRVQQLRNQTTCPEHFTDEEWEQQKQLVDEAIALMDSYREKPSYESRQSLRNLLKDIDGVQGDDYRNFRWTTVRFVRSGDLLKSLSKPSSIGERDGLVRFLKRQNLSRCQKSRLFKQSNRYE